MSQIVLNRLPLASKTINATKAQHGGTLACLNTVRYQSAVTERKEEHIDVKALLEKQEVELPTHGFMKQAWDAVKVAMPKATPIPGVKLTEQERRLGMVMPMTGNMDIPGLKKSFGHKAYTYKSTTDADGEVWNVFTQDRVQAGYNTSFVWLFVYFSVISYYVWHFRATLKSNPYYRETHRQLAERRKAGRDIKVSFFGPVPKISENPHLFYH